MTDDDRVPLDIADHEDRSPPGEEEGDGEAPAAGEDGEGAVADEDADGDGSAAGEDGEGAVADEDADGDGLPDRDELLSDVDLDGDEDAVQPVELLVNLAEDGEIDPWDIDVVVVTDKFLARLDDSDLRTSGRALFYASVLLRMKGDALLGEDEEEVDEETAEPWETGATAEADPVDQLEEEMDRRLDRKPARGSPETLEELVHELRDAERRMWWKDAREYDTSGSPEGFDRGTQTLDYHAADDDRMGGEPTRADVTGTTHDEDIEAVIEEVRAALREQYDKGREEVLYAEIEEAGGSRVSTYLALLFLAHRGHVVLTQDELFGDLWVRDTGGSAGESEAIAD